MCEITHFRHDKAGALWSEMPQMRLALTLGVEMNAYFSTTCRWNKTKGAGAGAKACFRMRELLGRYFERDYPYWLKVSEDWRKPATCFI